MDYIDYNDINLQYFDLNIVELIIGYCFVVIIISYFFFLLLFTTLVIV